MGSSVLPIGAADLAHFFLQRVNDLARIEPCLQSELQAQ
jgi:hypothetical protein